jgi:hypothetical protein
VNEIGEAVSVHAVKAYWEWRYSTVHSLASGSDWMSGELHAAFALPHGNKPEYALNRKLDWAPEPVRICQNLEWAPEPARILEKLDWTPVPFLMLGKETNS